MKNFPGHVRSPQMFKYKEKTAFTYNIQRVFHCRKLSMKQNVDVTIPLSTLYLSEQHSTQTGCYTTAACFPFEPLEKCTTFHDIFPGLSRSWN